MHDVLKFHPSIISQISVYDFSISIEKIVFSYHLQNGCNEKKNWFNSSVDGSLYIAVPLLQVGKKKYGIQNYERCKGIYI